MPLMLLVLVPKITVAVEVLGQVWMLDAVAVLL
jgi:hypothetical protein